MKQVALGARPSFICLSRASKRSCCSSYHIFTIILTKTKGSYLHKLHNHFVNINFEHTFKTFKLCFNQKLHIFNWVIHVLRYIQLFLSLIPKNNSHAPLEDHGISFSLFYHCRMLSCNSYSIITWFSNAEITPSTLNT